MDDGVQQMSRLFALLLGFGIAEVLSDLARAWRIKAGAEAVRAKIRIGPLIPLLGLLVILDQTSFVITSVELQAHVPFNYWSLLSILAVIGGYYVISTFISPDRPAEWPRFDVYYVKVRKIVVGGMIAINLATLAYEFLLLRTGVQLGDVAGAGGSGMGFSHPIGLALELAFFPILIGLFVTRSRTLSLWLLIAANALMFIDAALPLTWADEAATSAQDVHQVAWLFTLLLGMSIAVLLGGLARSWRVSASVTERRRHIRIGTLVPLLGLLLIFDQTSFFMTTYAVNAQLPFSYLSLLGVLVVIGGYFAISTFVFPSAPEEWPDFNAYYLKINRVVLGGMILVNFATMIGTIALMIAGVDIPDPVHQTGLGAAIGLIDDLLFLPVIMTLYFVKSKRANYVLLVAANALMVIDALSAVI